MTVEAPLRSCTLTASSMLSPNSPTCCDRLLWLPIGISRYRHFFASQQSAYHQETHIKASCLEVDALIIQADSLLRGPMMP